jgi:apolipoprotein N-acyltransferase
VVIVQPNYEPHFEKFNIPQNTQLLRVESLLDSVWNSDVNLIVLPETFIIDWIWESRIEVAPVVQRMRSWLKNHPNTQILTGASTGKLLKESQHDKTTARQSSSGIWYEVFNTALLISVDEPVQIFHKSKLVPGAEMTPYQLLFKPILEKFPIELAGSIGNFGVNDSIFNLNSKQGAFTSLICYESIFGEYVSKFMLKDAEWICLISNDGWWGHTYGHQQLHSYARLRALENRRYIARSANTGISSVINPKGIVEQFLPYSQKGIINATIFKSDVITFYSKYGDYIGRLASFLAIVYILQLISTFLRHKRSIK